MSPFHSWWVATLKFKPELWDSKLILWNHDISEWILLAQGFKIKLFPYLLSVRSVTQSCLTLYKHMDYGPWDYPSKNPGVGWHFLLQMIFPTQGSNPHLLWLLHWQADSLPLSHLGSPPISSIWLCWAKIK